VFYTEHEEWHGAGEVDEARSNQTQQPESAEYREQRGDHAHVGEGHVTAVCACARSTTPSGDGGEHQHGDDGDRYEARVVADVVARFDLRAQHHQTSQYPVARSPSCSQHPSAWLATPSQRPRVHSRHMGPLAYTMKKQRSCMEKEIMQGTMPGARRRGRPRTAWMDYIKTWTGLTMEESVRMAEDRDKRRNGVANPRIEDG